MTRFDALLVLLLAPLLVSPTLVAQSRSFGLLPSSFRPSPGRQQGQFGFGFLTFLVLSAERGASAGVRWASGAGLLRRHAYLATLFLLRRRHGSDWAALLLPPKAD